MRLHWDVVFTCPCSGLPLLQPPCWDRHWEAKTHRQQRVTSSSWATFHQLFLNGLYFGVAKHACLRLGFYLQNSSGCLWEYFMCKEYKTLCHRCSGAEMLGGLWVTSPKAAWISLESVDTETDWNHSLVLGTGGKLPSPLCHDFALQSCWTGQWLVTLTQLYWSVGA